MGVAVLVVNREEAFALACIGVNNVGDLQCEPRM